MIWLGNKLLLALVELFLLTLNLAIAFLTNIAMYEVTTGVTFDWPRLFHAPLFWIILVCQLLYFIASIAFQVQSKINDDKLDKAIEKGQVNLAGQAVAYSKRGDFESAKEVIRLLDELGERRHR